MQWASLVLPIAALSVSSVWDYQRKMSSVVISGQFPDPGGAMGGAGCVLGGYSPAFLCESKVQLSPQNSPRWALLAPWLVSLERAALEAAEL